MIFYAPHLIAHSSKKTSLHLECMVSGKMVLIVLDEMDQLDSKNQEVLYTIFEWPSLPDSRLVLIGKSLMSLHCHVNYSGCVGNI